MTGLVVGKYVLRFLSVGSAMSNGEGVSMTRQLIVKFALLFLLEILSLTASALCTVWVVPKDSIVFGTRCVGILVLEIVFSSHLRPTTFIDDPESIIGLTLVLSESVIWLVDMKISLMGISFWSCVFLECTERNLFCFVLP